MTPAARAQAAIETLDAVLAGAAAEATLLRWARGARYAGSKDRAAVRDLVFDALRRLRSAAARGGGRTGRGLVAGLLIERGEDPDALFGQGPYAPPPVADAERAARRAPTASEARDVPDWLWPALERSLGPDAAAICARLRDRAPVHLRVNAARTDRGAAARGLAAEGVETRPVPLSPTALEVTAGARRLRAAASLQDGRVELQDAASQAVADLVPVRPGARVLDWCAGGGGKTLALAARHDGPIDAWDADPGRMSDLPARARRAGARVRVLDRPPEGHWDTILVDAPCSGSGAWRRSPEGKWRLDEARLDDLTRRQSAILAAAAEHLSPGGALVYATCSLLDVENGRVAARSGLPVEVERRWTPLDGGDGFYAAVLRSEGR